MDLANTLQHIQQGYDLNAAEMTAAMKSIMSGRAEQNAIQAFLLALRAKGETITEIVAAAKVMRHLATPIPVTTSPLVDIVGTGGDGANIFNVSTASAIVVAAAGGSVAKHGNRSVSSKSGSADVIEAAGVELNLTPQQVAQCVDELGIGFLFAPHHHSAMKHAIAARKAIGVRSIFNLLGPLTNPAGATRLLLGVYAKKWLLPIANALGELGVERALVVHSRDGLDEISIAAVTDIAELNNGNVAEYSLDPVEFDLYHADLQTLVVNNPQQSLELIQAVFCKQTGPARDMVVFNAGAAIYVTGIVDSITQGVACAQAVIDSSKAEQKLTQLVQLSQQLGK